MTAYKASMVHKVPYQTLLDKLINIYRNPSGHATVYNSPTWQTRLPGTKEPLLQFVEKLVKEELPGRLWFEAFKKKTRKGRKSV